MAKPQTVWVLTSEYNDHDQHGEYFLAVFGFKPDAHEMIRFLAGEDMTAVQLATVAIHLVEKGGGRLGVEYCWYHLREVTLLPREKV